MKWVNFLAVPLIVVFSCHTKPKMVVAVPLRDKVAEEYLRGIDSVQGFDTTERNYQLLRAYIRNDTNLLIEFRKNEESDKQNDHLWDAMDSYVHQPKLQDLGVDEAYRFNFSFAFCPDKLDVTMSKKDSTVNLHFIRYRYQWDTKSGSILDEYDKELTIKDWDDFKQAMDHTDFWALKKSNGINGLDGDNIIVSGYIKGNTSFRRPARFNLVRRWGVHGTSLGEPFDLALILSDNRKGCYVLFRRTPKKLRN